MENSFDFWSIQTTVFLTLLTLVCWYIKFHWDKRHIYRISAKIPGPKGYPIIGNYLDFILGGTTTDEIYGTVRGYFSKYPDCFKFWLGPKLFIGIDKPEYFEIVLNHPQCLAKDPVYVFLQDYMGEGLLTAPVHKWRKHRKLINPAFNQKILDTFVGVFSAQAKILVKSLEEKIGKNFDIFEIVSACNIDTICETAMGIKVNAQTNGNQFGKILDKGMEIACLRLFSPWYQYDLIFRLSKYWKNYYKCLIFLSTFTADVVAEKKKIFIENKRKIETGEVIEEQTKWKTFLDLLLQLSDNGRTFSDKELQDEVNTFMAAGSDTTAASICFSLIMMGMHPEVQEKLHREILDVLGEDRDVTPEDLHHLEYMGRFIKETLRCFPLGPVILRKPVEDIDLGDVQIPANCSVMMSVIAMHRSPKYWKDPLKFDPDRFLPEEVAKRHPFSHIPFSGGPRGCIGSNYATMAIKSILCTVIRKLIFKTEYKSIEEIDLKVNILLRPSNGFKVSVEPRE